jgi:hypothetical protein
LNDLAGKVLVVISGKYSDSSRVRYARLPEDEQICFVEYQKGDPTLQCGLFYATGAGDNNQNCGWAEDQRKKGKVVRLWNTENDGCGPPGSSLPATNEPFFGWYGRYSKKLNAVSEIPFASVIWNNPEKHDKGIYPDVGINNAGFVVEVHQSNNYFNELWYNTGKLVAGSETVQWFTGNKFDRNYDTGIAPSVDINDSLIVMEVHQSENTNHLYCNIGKLDTLTGQIHWFIQSYQYDVGENPNVAINENMVVVEVHRAYYSENLWYNVGKISGHTIQWGAMGDHRNYETGYYPAVAVHGTTVFEMHGSSTEYLWSIIGKLDESGLKINWLADNGDTTYSYPCEERANYSPSPALNGTDALEIHFSFHTGIWWRPGKLRNSMMAMDASRLISGIALTATEQNVSLDMNNQVAILMYISGNEDLIYMTGELE